MNSPAPAPRPATTGEPTLLPLALEHCAAIHSLVAACKPLDVNSVYLYLLLARHFPATCVLALRDGAPAGFISGYVPPDQPDTLFVWQVAVHPDERGRGLGRRMLEELLRRDALAGVRRLETTVSPSNRASLALFQSLADHLGAPLSRGPLFEKNHFGAEAHEDEHLVTIGPFSLSQQNRSIP